MNFNPPELLLKAIDDALKVASKEEPRYHLGASEIADKCLRRIWYSFRWATKKAEEPKMVRLLNRGHLEEERFVSWLRAIGVEVWREIDGKRIRFVGYHGHFGGELDGVGRFGPISPDPFLLEFKTHNDRNYKTLVANRVVDSFFSHFVQSQMYMGAYKLPNTMYMAINKNTDELFLQWFAFEPEVYQRFLDVAKFIIDAPEPPERISVDPNYWMCRFCEHRPVCHMRHEPQRNCRTCAHSTPCDNALWVCEQDPQNKFAIEKKIMLVGCQRYERHPMH
jgi:hypothetical protein